jgi:hypothetical protein
MFDRRVLFRQLLNACVVICCIIYYEEADDCGDAIETDDGRQGLSNILAGMGTL